MSARLSFREVLGSRVLVADGAMGTMLQAQDPTLDDFEGHEGCNEVLNVTRPDIVRAIHDAYFAGRRRLRRDQHVRREPRQPGRIRHRGAHLRTAEAGARIAREAADASPLPSTPRWVLGSVGPGTKLPTLGHAPYAGAARRLPAERGGLIGGGADAIVVETCQDLLQAKAAIIGARRARPRTPATSPIIAQVTIETTGTMLLGSEIGAALTALEPLGIDMIGLNCATGPAEMSEHLRYLARHARIPLSCMPNAGLPVLGADGAHYPLAPAELADAHETFTARVRARAGGRLLRHHPRAPAPAGGPRAGQAAHPPAAPARARRRLALPARAVPPGHLVPGDRRAHQRQRLEGVPRGACWPAAGTTAWRSPAQQIRDGAHLLDLCVDYVGRDGVRRHDGAGLPVRHRLHAADRARLHRGGGAAGGPGDAGRARGASTRSTTRTATAPTPGSPGSARWPRSTAPR